MIEIEAPDGSVVEFPDGTPDTTITDVMRRNFGGPAPAGESWSPGATPAAAVQDRFGQMAPATGGSASATPVSDWEMKRRALAAGVQGVGRSAAKLLGAPVDIATTAANIPSALVNSGADAINYVFGTKLNPEMPYVPALPGGSQNIREIASNEANRAAEGVPSGPLTPVQLAGRAYGSVFGPTIPEKAQSAGARRGATVGEFATDAALAAVPLSWLSMARMGSKKPSVLDPFTRPYAEAPVQTAIGDAAGGAGSGVMVNIANEQYPDSPMAQTLAQLGGAFGGVGALEGAKAAGRTALKYIPNPVNQGVSILNKGIDAFNATTGTKFGPIEYNTGRGTISLPGEAYPNNTFSRSEVEAAAEILQGRMSGSPNAAAANISENAQWYRDRDLPVPSVGLISDDIGMQTAESAGRTKNPTRFVENDNRLRDAAAERANSIRDPGADQNQPRMVAQTEAALQTTEARRAGQGEVRQAETEARRGVSAAQAAAEDAVKRAQAEVDAGIAGAQGRLTAAQQSLREVEAGLQQQAAPVAAVANTGAQEQASVRLDRTLVDEGYIPARTEKNRQFDTAPGRNDMLPADDVLGAVDDVLRRNNALRPDAQLPQDLVARLERLRPQIDPETGENVGGPGVARGGDLADVRKWMESESRRARKAGNYDLAKSVDRLRAAINQTIEQAPGYADANQNYGAFRDRYKPSPNDPGTEFVEKIDRDRDRGSTPPSQTAKRFLAGPERVDALVRMLGPDGDATPVRDYLRSDFGQSALNPDGTINANRAVAWGRNNAATLERFPHIRQEFDDLLATARRGGQLSTEAKANLDAATRGVTEAERTGRQMLRTAERQGEMGVRAAEQEGAATIKTAEKSAEARAADTQRRIDNSAAGTLINADPRDAAKGLLNGGYGALKKAEEIRALIGADPEAKRGWQAAVAEVISDQVAEVARTARGEAGSGPNMQTSLARLEKLFKDNEDLLTRVFDGGQMSKLRQAHAALAPLKNANVRATAGSDTADKFANLFRLAEGPAKLYFGMLKGGGIVRSLRMMVDQLPNNKGAVQDIIERVWFNPELAEYLLTMKVNKLEGKAANARVQAILAGATYAREKLED